MNSWDWWLGTPVQPLSRMSQSWDNRCVPSFLSTFQRDRGGGKTREGKRLGQGPQHGGDDSLGQDSPSWSPHLPQTFLPSRAVVNGGESFRLSGNQTQSNINHGIRDVRCTKETEATDGSDNSAGGAAKECVLMGVSAQGGPRSRVP